MQTRFTGIEVFTRGRRFSRPRNFRKTWISRQIEVAKNFSKLAPNIFYELFSLERTFPAFQISNACLRQHTHSSLALIHFLIPSVTLFRLIHSNYANFDQLDTCHTYHSSWVPEGSPWSPDALQSSFRPATAARSVWRSRAGNGRGRWAWALKHSAHCPRTTLQKKKLQ